MPITALPTPPSRQDPSNFNDRADAFLGALPTFATEANALQENVNNSETNAVNASNAAISATNITKWISGTSYSEGAVVWSPINGLAYRRMITGSGTTDPSLDTTNYKQVNGTGDVSTSGNQTINDTKTFTSTITGTITNALNATIATRTSRGGGNLSSNTANGENALISNTGGSSLTAIGVDALRNYLGTGGFFGGDGQNTAVGAYSLKNAIESEYNTAIGNEALYTDGYSSGNTAVGFYSMRDYNSGGTSLGQNTAVGAWSLKTASGDGNTALGAYSLQNNYNYTYSTGVGIQASVTGSNQLQLGYSSVTTYAYGAVQNRSDLRDKTDIRDTILGLEFINSLRPVDYRWDMREFYRPERPADLPKDATEEQITEYNKLMQEWSENCKLSNITHDGSKKRNRYHHGVIAQEVKAVIDKMGVDFGGYQDHKIAGGDDVLSVGYEEFIAPLIKAVQELSAKVKTLEDKLAASN